MEERLDFQRYLDAYQYISSNLKTKYECRDLIEQQKDTSINSQAERAANLAKHKLRLENIGDSRLTQKLPDISSLSTNFSSH